MADIEDVKRQRAHEGLSGGAGGAGTGEFDIVGDAQFVGNGSKLFTSGA